MQNIDFMNLIQFSLSPLNQQSGLAHEWGVELYGELLEIGGGKERMTKYFKVWVHVHERCKSN